ALYREFTYTHVQSLLRQMFPDANAVVGPEKWKPLEERFFAVHPCRHWELNANAEPFLVFLGEHVASGEEPVLPPWLPELCDFEWNQFVAYSTDVEVPTSVEGPELNPTVVLKEYRFSVHQVVHDRSAIPEEDPHVVAFFRDAEHVAHW